jgi:hypothetical protein
MDGMVMKKISTTPVYETEKTSASVIALMTEAV